jgi:NDP-sugar pyrophosphorylase family protein
MRMKLNAFIPAAGLGTRLQPVTHHIPKPLLPVLGCPIIECVLDKLFDLPVENVGINLHHHGDKIKSWCQRSHYSNLITFFTEDKILGTGGALFNARSLLKQGTFIVYNGDVVSDIDLLFFYEYHMKSRNIATLAVHDFSKYNDVGVNKDGEVVAVRDKGKPAMANKFKCFTGIAIYEPEFLDCLPSGVSHVTDSWLTAVRKGLKVGACDASDSEWTDLGVVGAYAEKVADELCRRGETRYIGNNVYVPIDCKLNGLVTVESESRIGIGVELENCIVLPGGVVKGGARIKNKLVVGEEQVPLKSFKKKKGAPLPDIKSGGSNRIYIKLVLSDDLTGMLLNSNSEDNTFERQIAYTKFFKKSKIPVPRLLSYDHRRYKALFEDLGKKDLFNWFHEGRNEKETVSMYEKVLDSLIKFQNVRPAGCPLLKEWIFDRQALLWESKYFLDRFVKGYLNISPKDENLLLEEFKALAQRVDQYPKRIMHRDFQSRNIMLARNEIYFIDYQAARMGPPAYDAVSLIFDPYCPLDEEAEQILVNYYIKRFCKIGKYREENLEASFTYCALQRHMQALGAYGYLSRIKGKQWFESHIPRAVALLLRDIKQVETVFPGLCELVRTIADKH